MLRRLASALAVFFALAAAMAFSLCTAGLSYIDGSSLIAVAAEVIYKDQSEIESCLLIDV